MASERIEQRPFLRPERVPDDALVVVRGGPNSIARLTQDAMRTARFWDLDGEPLLGVSVLFALDDVGPASLPDACDPDFILPGGIVVAGEPDAPAMVEIIDLTPVGAKMSCQRFLDSVSEPPESSPATERSGLDAELRCARVRLRNTDEDQRLPILPSGLRLVGEDRVAGEHSSGRKMDCVGSPDSAESLILRLANNCPSVSCHGL